MKNFLLKSVDIILTIIMLVSAFYAVFNLVMSFLPNEIQRTVFDYLHISKEYIATFSISATINACVLIATKFIQTYSRIKLTTQITQAENINANTIMVNNAVIEKTNAVINNLNILQNLVNAVLSVQKVTTERNIKASDKLVYTEEKEAYKKALEEIEKVRTQLLEVNNLSTVYEKTEIKEVVIEKDFLSGRV